ncbi:sugar kinase [Vibrio sp. HN007]|uniref:sugar kinase n=1 Tax=Vibrio iocasae TaxID=3098914 RepID=UPI0035D4A437
MKKIAIIGECMIELNGEPFGSMNQTFGGDTLNAAVYLSRSCSEGVEIQYVTSMGTDALSEGMIQRWQQEGVGTDLVLRDNARSPGLYLIQTDETGERTFLYWRNQSAAKYMLRHHDFGEVEAALREMDMIFLSGITLAILEPSDRKRLIALLAELSSMGTEIAFDSNFRPALWPDDANQTIQESYKALLEFCSLALITLDDEQAIWGDKTYQETLNRCKRFGTQKVVVKMGANGCVYQDFSRHKEPISVPTDIVRNVVDTTSAGDSFNGGFLASYLTGKDMRTACVNGNALAGIVIQHRGAIVSKQETDMLIKG